MKEYIVTINGKTFAVSVEEKAEAGQIKPSAATAAPKVQAASAPVSEAAAANAKVSVSSDEEAITAPMPGKVLRILKHEGDTVKQGETVVVIEAMKMENELTAPHEGVITSIPFSEGSAVELGSVLATVK